MYTSRVNYIVLDDQTYSGLLNIQMYDKIEDEAPQGAMVIGPNNGGMKIKVTENGGAIQFYMSDMEQLVRSLPVESFLSASKQPIGDLAAIIQILKPFL